MYKRGEIYFATLEQGLGSEQNGFRPVIILQNDIGNELGQTTIIAPITSKQKKYLPTHVEISKHESGILEDSIILLEHIQTIDKSRMISFVGCATKELMEKIETAIHISLGVERKELCQMHYINDEHKKIFEFKICRNPYKFTNEYIAAVYLLSSEKSLWNVSKGFVKLNDISFDFRANGITEVGYLLYKFARIMYESLSFENIYEFYDERIMPNEYFEVIITALRICRHGLPYTGLKKTYLSQ